MQIKVDGYSVYVATGGADWVQGQRPLCLIHGASLDHSVWTLYSRYFARKGYNVIAPDLAGHARTGGVLPDSIEAMADWLTELLDQCSAQHPAFGSGIAICGHSMGSLVALEAAARKPDQFSQLILLGTAVPMRVGQVLLDAAQANKPLSRDIVAVFGHSYQSQLGGNPVSGIHLVNSALALMARAGDGVMYRDMLNCHQYEAGLESASKVTAATSLILGSEDRMTPPSQAMALLDRLADPALTILDGSGHMMMSEAPEQTLQAIMSGLAREAASPT